MTLLKRDPVPDNNILKRSNSAVAVATKLVESTRSASQKRMPDFSALRTLIDKNTQSQTDAKNVLEVNPELELAGKILTSCIISPNDLTSTELFWSTEDIVGDSELTNKLIEHLKKFFRDEYKLEDKISDWIYKALFTEGSFPICVIPESSLDDLINGPTHNPMNFSFESASVDLDKMLLDRKKKHLEGLASSANKLNSSLESAIPISKKTSNSSLGDIRITCDISKLKIGNFNRMKREFETSKHINSSFEDDRQISYGNKEKQRKISKSELAGMFHARRTHGKSQYVRLKTNHDTSRANIGHPLHMYLPPESVAPVVNPGEPENPVGFLVLLDENKNPISRSRGSNYFDQMRNHHNEHSKTITSVHSQMFGKDIATEEITQRTVDELYTAFSKNVESTTIGKLRDGLYDSSIELGDTNDFYRIMFTRTLENANTEILYIPNQLMTYLTYNQNEYGVGVSLLEKNKMLSSLKSVVVFSNAMANMNNAIPRKEYKINFDPTDENPDKTMEQIMTNIGTGLSNGYVFSDTNPMSIINSMLMSAIQISVEGHPEYNDTTVETNEVRTERSLVDRDYETSVSERLIQGLTLPPELVNSASTVDFALEAANRNLMFSKTVKGYQKISNEGITDSVQKYTINSGKLTSELLTIISEHKVVKESEVVKDFEESTGRTETKAEQAEAEKETNTVMDVFLTFMDKLRVNLPSPEETKVSNQIQLFETYSSGIENTVDKLLTDDRITLILGEESRDYSNSIREMASGYLIRQYMSKNNVFPELMELINVSDTDILKDIEHQYTNQSGLEKALFEFVKQTAARNKTPEESNDTDGDSGNDDSYSY